MTNKDLISQYVDTGIGIPEYQFNKLSNNDKKTYLRKMEINIDRNIDNLKYYYGELPEHIQLKYVKQDGLSIKYFLRKGIEPSEEVQLAAVKQDGSAIQYIENPSEEVQLAAVKQNGRVLEVLPNASEAVQLAAIKNKPFTMIYINNPSENIQLTALRVATTDVDAEEASTTLLTLYPYISDKNKVKVVNYLLNNEYITYPFYEKSNDGIKHLILNRIFSDKIFISYRFYELLPENKKLDYLKMEIGYANETQRFLGGWIIQEYKKLTGVKLVRDKINKQYVKRDD